MDYAEEEFLAVLYSKLLVTWPVYEILKKAFEGWFDVHESGQLIWMEKSCPWKSFIYKLEEENKCENEIKFILF